jgi:hypothetical protein
MHKKKLTAHACESFTKCYWKCFLFVFNSQLGLKTSLTNICTL